MNVALVLDLRGDVAVETASGCGRWRWPSPAREAGNRFQLVVAGRPGAVLVAREFKHPAHLALDRLLWRRPARASASPTR
jgi:hypothetical protein